MIQRQDGQQIHILFHIADQPTAQPLLALNAWIQLGLIKRTTALVVHNILQQYHDVFEDLGIMNGKQPKNHVDTSVITVIYQPRKVPFPMLNRLREELSRLELLTVIHKVDHPTDWVNSLRKVEKPNGKLRLCLDPKDFNKAIKRHHYELPTAETISAKMSGATVFSKIDASNGYWQIAVDSESSDLLTFNTPFRRYKFLRLPFGLESAFEVLLKAIAEVLEGLEGIQNMQDDIVVFVTSAFQHKERFEEKVMVRICSSGLKINKEKCSIKVPQITFLGHTISAAGISADPSKVKDVLRIEPPSYTTELRRFLGKVIYLSKFIKNLSAENENLRKLLRSDADWDSLPHHQA